MAQVSKATRELYDLDVLRRVAAMEGAHTSALGGHSNASIGTALLRLEQRGLIRAHVIGVHHQSSLYGTKVTKRTWFMTEAGRKLV